MRESRQAELHEQETQGHYTQGKVVAANEETNARREDWGSAMKGQGLPCAEFGCKEKNTGDKIDVGSYC